jgi:hypothetical protein
MNKILVLGDIHGQDIWKSINPDDYDKIVFIGDYVDSFTITPHDQLNNLMDIIQFKKDNPDKVILLFGNHDYHYLVDDQRYSGYDPVFAPQFRMVFREHIKLFQMVYEPFGRIYCSHAGITFKWLKTHGITQDKDMMNTINDYLYYKPQIFKFVGSDPYGDTPHNSPIWVRLNSLHNYGIPGTHIVGHTSQINEIRVIEGPKNSIYCIDVLPKQVLLIDHQKPTIINLIK